MTVLIIIAVLLAILYLGIGFFLMMLTAIYRHASLLFLLYALFLWPLHSYFLRKEREKMDKDYDTFKTKRRVEENYHKDDIQ